VEGEHEHAHEPTQVITPVVETESQLTAPLIDHASKIAHIEDQQARQQEESLRQIASLEERLTTATGSQVSALQARIDELEGRLAAPVQEDLGIPDESVELTLPDVEPSPEPPEKVRQGMRHRRKAKKKGK
jgi:hypothetical protein